MVDSVPAELVAPGEGGLIAPPGTDELLRQFQIELPWHLRCTPKVAELSMYSVRAFLHAQSEPFPECFDYPRLFAWLRHLSETAPFHRNKLRRESSAVNSHLKALKRFGKWAIARGFIRESPAEKLKIQREPERIIFAPPDTAMLALLNSLEGFGRTVEGRARNYALLCFMLDAGPRAGEVLAMQVSDVFDDGQPRQSCVLHGNGKRDRVVALSAPVREALSRYMLVRRPVPGESRLWVTDDGTGMTYVALRQMLRRLCERAGVKVALHDFRRYAHTKLWLSHIDQVSGMAISGHRSTEVYVRYIRGAIQQRALADHIKHSPLQKLLESREAHG